MKVIELRFRSEDLHRSYHSSLWPICVPYLLILDYTLLIHSIEGSYDQTRSHFSNFYSLRTVDVDGDGDFDIVPDHYANWGSIPYVNNLFWEKVGNKFIRRIN